MLIGNVRGPYSVIRALVPLLKASGDGVVVSVSSVSAFTATVQVRLVPAQAPDQPARIELLLSDDGVTLASQNAADAARTLGAGVLVIGERAWEVTPRFDMTLAPAGVELARIEAKPVVMPPQATGSGARPGGGILSALGLGSGTTRPPAAFSSFTARA